MVYKTEKHGVRTGQTCRNHGKRFRQRYRRHAFLLRMHIASHPDPTFHTCGILDDEPITDMVEYSLNKQRRWELPDVIENLILNGDTDDFPGDYGYQLVQRHYSFKLNNCFRIAANQSLIHNGQLKRFRVLRFKGQHRGGLCQLNSVILNANQRKRKNPPFEIQQRHYQPVKVDNVLDDSDEEVTEEPITDYQNEDDKEMPIVRYEVVVPTPETCYIAHELWSARRPIREPFCRGRAKSQKSKKRTDWFNNITEVIEEHTAERKESPYENKDCSVGELEHTYNIEKENTYSLHDLLTRQSTNVSDIITSRVFGRHKSALPSPTKGQILHMYDHFEQPKMTPEPVEKRKTVQMDVVKVILQNNDVAPERLSTLFGRRYCKAKCSPRKFAINISGRILPAKTKHVSVYLVFIYDAEDDANSDSESVFNILINAHVDESVFDVELETVRNYDEVTIEELIEKTLLYFNTNAKDTLEIEINAGPVGKRKLTEVESCASWSTTSYHPERKFLMKFLRRDGEKRDELYNVDGTDNINNENAVRRRQTLGQVDRESDSHICGICFDEFELEDMTALDSCGHHFCNNCWKEHIHIQIDRIAMNLQCSGFRCDHRIDYGTLLSLVNVRELVRHSQYFHDHQVEVNNDKCWCPNKLCGRTVQIDTNPVSYAHCACGTKFCMQCMEKHHWPATCDGVKAYVTKLKSSGDISLLPEGMAEKCVINGKNCPLCNRFVEKQGGCSLIQCICGSEFCWGCGQPWNARYHGKECNKNGTQDKHGTHQHLIKPERIDDKKRDTWYKMAVTHRLYQHPNYVSKLRMTSQEIAKKLKSYIVKARHKGMHVSLGFAVDNKKYKTEADKVEDWLKYSLDMYDEVNHLIENTCLLLGFTKLQNETRLRVQYVLKRLIFFGGSINTLISNISPTSTIPAAFLSQMKETLLRCKESIRSLVRICRHAGLSPSVIVKA